MLRLIEHDARTESSQLRCSGIDEISIAKRALVWCHCRENGGKADLRGRAAWRVQEWSIGSVHMQVPWASW